MQTRWWRTLLVFVLTPLLMLNFFGGASAAALHSRSHLAGPGQLPGMTSALGTPSPRRVWWPQASGTAQALYGIQFVDAKAGWAVGAAGTILSSLDGGATWIQQSSRLSETLQAVHFVDAHNGWAVGDAGTIIHTTDGGQIWVRQHSNTSANLRALDFVDSLHGWVVGENSTIRATDDGGITWRVQTPPAGFSFLMGFAVVFWDQQHGWLAPWAGIPAGGVLATTDGGQTWTRQPTGEIYYLTGVDFISADEGWAASYVYGAAECPGFFLSHIFHTSDGGTTWVDISTLCGYSGVLDAVDTSHSWLITSDGVGPSQIMASADGGRTFIPEAASAQTRYLSMLSASEGWAVGDGGVILHYVAPSYMFLPLISWS